MATHGVQCPFCDADYNIGDDPVPTPEVDRTPVVRKESDNPEILRSKPSGREQSHSAGAVRPKTELPPVRTQVTRSEEAPSERERNKLPVRARAQRVLPTAEPSQASRTVESRDDVTEFLEIDPLNPDEVRKRRVERRKIVPMWQTAANSTLTYGAAAVFAVVGILIAMGIFGIGNLVREGTASTPTPVAQAPSVVAPTSGVLTKQEVREAAEAVRACFSSDSLGSMLDHVRDPDRVEPRMEDWYSRHPFGGFVPGNVILSKKDNVGHGRQMIILSMEIEEGIGPKYYHVEQTPSGSMLVDWEVTVGYLEMPLADFRKNRPTEVVPFRVRAKLSDYYNYEFSDPEKYQSVEIYYPGEEEFRLDGYVERDSKTGTRLASLLEFMPHNLVLGLRFPPDARTDNLVEIVSIEGESWYR